MTFLCPKLKDIVNIVHKLAISRVFKQDPSLAETTCLDSLVIISNQAQFRLGLQIITFFEQSSSVTLEMKSQTISKYKSESWLFYQDCIIHLLITKATIETPLLSDVDSPRDAFKKKTPSQPHITPSLLIC